MQIIVDTVNSIVTYVDSHLPLAGLVESIKPRQFGYGTKKKYKATTKSDHKKPVYDNELKQDSDVQHPNQA